jgi:beta-glucosidase-like glycosyl hydrolase
MKAPHGTNNYVNTVIVLRMMGHNDTLLLGQLIMPRLEINAYLVDEHYAEKIRRLVQNQMAGGFCIFGGDPAGVAHVVLELQRIAAANGNIPLLFSCDCEFGLPMRLTEGGTEFPDAMAIAKTGEPELAFKTGQAIAREMRSLGISWNFAPVADVNSNPNNPIINTRSFGEDPATVAKYASAFMLGLQSEGVAATAKHFPGHGDTSVDSHSDLPVIDRDWERFRAIELSPFQALIKDGVSSVMTGHLAAPQLAAHSGATEEERNLPATLSFPLTTTLLRKEMGFEGVIVTDALEMRAITENFGLDDVSRLAFQAGADVLLMPPDPVSTFNTLIDALEKGRISISEVKKRADRIHRFKERTHVPVSGIQPEHLVEFETEHLNLAKEIANRSVQISGTVLLANAKMIILTDDRPDAIKKAKLYETHLKPFVSDVNVFTASNWSEEKMHIDVDSILVTFHRARGYVNPVSEKITIRTVVREIAGLCSLRGISPRGLILFGSPYLDSEFEMLPSFVMKTFSESNASIIAAAEKLQLKK